MNKTDRTLEILKNLQNDLLMRADKDADGTRAVKAGFTVWEEFCELIEELEESTGR